MYRTIIKIITNNNSKIPRIKMLLEKFAGPK